MEKYTKHLVNLYVQGLITADEMASLLAKEYAKLWARGQILALLGE